MVNSPLEGISTVRNLRDLGGYPTNDGKVIRSGLVYRSGSLADLSREDEAKIRSLGLRTVIDLRPPTTREKQPDRIDRDAVHYLGVDLRPAVYFELRDRLNAPDLTEPECRRIICSVTAAIPIDCVEGIKTIFQILAKPGSMPILVHCHSGKDRTGVVIAFLLYALGVPKEVIHADYRLSSDYLKSLRDAKIEERGPCIAPWYDVQPQYIEGAFSAVREAYGSIETYLATGLAFSDQMRLMLQSRLLLSQRG